MALRVRQIVAVAERPGNAAVEIAGWTAGVAGLRYFICQSHDTPRYLSPHGTPSERVWLEPDGVRQLGAVVQIEIRAGLVRKLPSFAMVEIGLTNQEQVEVGIARAQWPGIDTPDEWATEPAGEPPPARPEDDQTLPGGGRIPIPDAKPRAGGVRRPAVVLGLVVAILLSALGAVRWGGGDPSTMPATNLAANEPGLPEPGERLRAQLRGLGGEAAFTLGRALAEAGRIDDALLAHEHAAAQGHGPAAVEIARWYDPRTWSAEKSPFSNSNLKSALRWYEQAKRAGVDEAQADIDALREAGDQLRVDQTAGASPD